MLANVAVFVAQEYTGSSPEAWGFTPSHPSLTTWFTSMFVHAGVLHLLGNMLFLWLFGTLAEDVLGPWLFLGFYVGGNFGATALDMWVHATYAPTSLAVPRVGASGAIAGIMGLSAVCFTRTRVKVWYLVGVFIYWRVGVTTVSAPVFMGLWAVWELLKGILSTAAEATSGVPGGVAHWAHLGGLGIGLVGALALGLPRRIARNDLLSGRREPTTSLLARSETGELERLVEESPEDADAWNALGRSWQAAGHLDRAANAYGRATTLFLRQRRMADAVGAYQALDGVGSPESCPEELHFDLACALEAMGHPKDAFAIFRQVAARPGSGSQQETALIRAAELARLALGDTDAAAELYRTLLRDHPDSAYRGLCQDRLRMLALPEKRAIEHKGGE
jgi:membrane associated rhomboid family serine protease